MQLNELISGIDCYVCGNKYIDITGIALSKNASSGEIAILGLNENIQDVASDVVLVPLGLYDTEKTVIISMNVELTAIELANKMITNGMYMDYKMPVKYIMKPEYYRMGSNVVIGDKTSIEAFSSIGDDVIIGDNCYIGSNVTIGSNVRIGNNVHIGDGSRIGCSPTCNYIYKGVRKSFGGIAGVVIGNDVIFNCNCIVERGSFQDTQIGNNNVFSDAVCIGHDTIIQNNVYVMGQSCIASGVVVEDNVVICSQCGIKENIVLGKDCVIKGRTGVIKDVPQGGCIFGNVGQNFRDEIKIQSFLRQMIRR